MEDRLRSVSLLTHAAVPEEIGPMLQRRSPTEGMQRSGTSRSCSLSLP